MIPSSMLPGKIKTVLGRWGKSEDLVGPAIFLLSEASSYVTGTDLYVDGGLDL